MLQIKMSVRLGKLSFDTGGWSLATHYLSYVKMLLQCIVRKHFAVQKTLFHLNHVCEGACHIGTQ